MDEIELAMLSAQTKAFSPGAYSKQSTSNNTNNNVNTNNNNGGYNNQQNNNNYSSYDSGTNSNSNQYDYAEDWYSDYKDCQCCGGYTYKCSCVSNGYPSCANCNSHMNTGTNHDGYGNQMNMNTNSNGGGGSTYGNSYTKNLSTTASEFVPTFSNGTPAAAPTSTSSYHNPYANSFQPTGKGGTTYGNSTNTSRNTSHNSHNSQSATPCNMFSKEGYCKRGNKCKFAH
mgnify:CR=1 FL=1